MNGVAITLGAALFGASAALIQDLNALDTNRFGSGDDAVDPSRELCHEESAASGISSIQPGARSGTIREFVDHGRLRMLECDTTAGRLAAPTAAAAPLAN